jgi:hypothetical protein
MRIQDTDRILTESRIARTPVAAHGESEGVMERTWKSIAALPHRLATMFRHQ